MRRRGGRKRALGTDDDSVELGPARVARLRNRRAGQRLALPCADLVDDFAGRPRPGRAVALDGCRPAKQLASERKNGDLVRLGLRHCQNDCSRR